MRSVLILTTLSVCFQLVHLSHFRGAIIQWRPKDPANFDGTIIISHRIAWRRSYFSPPCDATAISNHVVFTGDGQLSCVEGCTGTIDDLSYVCTDYSDGSSPEGDWASGTRSYEYSLPDPTPTSFKARFTGCCWIPLVQGGLGWSIQVSGFLTPRPDNGLINSSPITSVTPIVRLQLGCPRDFRIPVQDPDGDTVQCRWAVGAEECGAVCMGFNPGTLSPDCTLSYGGGGTAGVYAVAVQIEDFLGGAVLSSVPVQFLVVLFESPLDCDASTPMLVPPTLQDGECIIIPAGGTFQTSLVAQIRASGSSIVRFTTSSPLGLTRTTVAQSPNDPTLYFSDVTWTPDSSQLGQQHIFTFSAEDSNGLMTETRSITLLAGVEGPRALQSSVSPTGVLDPPVTTFTVSFDQRIQRPIVQSFIRIFESATNQQVVAIDATSASVTFPPPESSDTSITFVTSFDFKPGKSYYILLDTGVASGRLCARQDSIAVLDPTFWTFSIDAHLVNDSVIGDPLMTVPIYIPVISEDEDLSFVMDNVVNLCYEIHGQDGEYFNLVSDTCVSVNAHYAQVDQYLSFNIMDEIAVRAVGLDGTCRNIVVDANTCQASIDGTPFSGSYLNAGISVRTYPNRVRITVPNCQDQDLVMWVFCVENEFKGYHGAVNAKLLHFVIARGVNLHETAHGLLGQFWNIPIGIEKYTGGLTNGRKSNTAYILTVNYPGSPTRRFVTFLRSVTWDERKGEYCLYGGDRQGGSIYEVKSPNDPVIEGKYTEYRVSGPFDVEFVYSHFDSSQCN